MTKLEAQGDANLRSRFDSSSTPPREPKEKAPSPQDSPPDLVILKQIAQGNLKYFDTFLDRYKGSLIKYLHSRVYDFHTAEDLAQEVLLRVFRAVRRGQYDDRNRSMSAWVFTIASHCLTDHQRERGRKPVTLDSDTECDSEDRSAIDNRTANTLEPSEAAIEIERQQSVFELLDRLPALQREVVRLKVYGGMTFAEIANALECPVATVKSRMRYALMKVHEMMKAE